MQIYLQLSDFFIFSPFRLTILIAGRIIITSFGQAQEAGASIIEDYINFRNS